MRRELTLCFLKPSLVKNPIAVDYVKNLLHYENFQIVKDKKLTLTNERANLFYKEHSEKFFFGRLVTFICSGPIISLVLARENAIAKWRELMGPTRVFQAIYSHPESLRGMFGLSDTRNCAHGSDSVQSARKEIEFFFPEFSVNEWYRNEENK